MGNTFVVQQEQETYVIPNWPDYKPQQAHQSFNKLLGDDVIKETPVVTLENVQKNSENFPISFPVQTVRCSELIAFVPKQVLTKNINSAYPVLHEHAIALYVNFLQHKRKYGYPRERELYANMSILQFVQRLLEKRAVTFINSCVQYRLLDGSDGCGGWERIGKPDETKKLNLQKCLSYEELKLSAFLSISSYTYFINNGNTYNNGKVQHTDVEPEGIIIGLIGAQLENPEVMEYQDIIITKDQNHEGRRCGNQHSPSTETLFSVFYGEVYVTHAEVLERRKNEPGRFVELENGEIFDNKMYCKRIALSIDTVLLEANQRAKEEGRMAFVHVVGIEVGILSPHQKSLFLDTFAKRIELLGYNLQSVSDVVFEHLDCNVIYGRRKNGDVIPIPEHPNGGIKIHIFHRAPHEILKKEHKGKLLVVSYVTDGNALPGNEFWVGVISCVGNPSTASSTQITELHNPHINPKICAANLRIATLNGVVPFSDYRETVKRVP